MISLLKDEEMSKVKSVVSEAKKQMKDAYMERVKELKDELKRQQEGIT